MSDDYPILLGRILGNLQSLECLLRLFILLKSGGKDLKYWSLNAGDVVPVDAFTNYDSLGKLVKKFNKFHKKQGQPFRVDPGVVDLRDLLAHGRVSSPSQDLPRMKILKFEKPRDGTVRVADASS